MGKFKVQRPTVTGRTTTTWKNSAGGKRSNDILILLTYLGIVQTDLSVSSSLILYYYATVENSAINYKCYHIYIYY